MSLDTRTKLTDIKVRVKLYNVVRERKKDCTKLGVSRAIHEK